MRHGKGHNHVCGKLVMIFVDAGVQGHVAGDLPFRKHPISLLELLTENHYWTLR